MSRKLPPIYSTSENWPDFSVDMPIVDIESMAGERFESSKCFANFDIATPFYGLFENPADSGVVVFLQSRRLKTDTAGLSYFQILWDYDVSNLTPTPMDIFNENNYYRTSNPGKSEISTLNPVTSPDDDQWTINGSTPPTDIGIEREPNFITTTGTGVGVNTAGGVAPDLGIRIYMPGTGFLTKAVSDGDNNRIIWGYTWFEIPLDRFNELYA